MKLITPQVWGEDAWRFMHVVALGFPEKPTDKDRADYKNFFYSLTRVLPCVRCRDGYDDIFRRIPINTESTDALFQWTVDVHNAVNRKLGHDVMDARWIRNVYVFREHEKERECKSEGMGQTATVVAGVVVLAVALTVAAGAWFKAQKGVL